MTAITDYLSHICPTKLSLLRPAHHSVYSEKCLSNGARHDSAASFEIALESRIRDWASHMFDREMSKGIREGLPPD
jgi:hypothetical protein